MPWQEQSQMSLRREFVTFAQQEALPMRVLCRQFGISPKTGYKWLARAAADASDPLADHSRRPQTSPRQTPPALEAAVVALRDAHPTWGGRKLHHWLRAHGADPVPAPSTITDILRRHGRIAADPEAPHPWQRFERAAPNELWQLDFMGHRPAGSERVHPLTLLDDHSRFLLGLWACENEQGTGVQTHLTAAFARYGLPWGLLTDNGPPWGATGQGGITRLEAWFLQLGITVHHGRPYHPQTQGKVERIHATIAADCFGGPALPDLAAAQPGFDHFRETYNHDRPHEALAFAVPASRYAPSPRSFPDRLPPIEYAPGDAVRKVRHQGAISYHNHAYFVGTGLIGLPVAVRPTTTDGVFAIIFCAQQIGLIDLHDHP
jgi:transposase InsO family protein